MCYKNQVQKIQENGLRSFLCDISHKVVRAVKEHPSDVILVCGGVLGSGYFNTRGLEVIALPIASTIGSLRSCKSILDEAKKMPHDTLVQAAIKCTLAMVPLYIIASIPAAAAKEFNSLSEAREYYNGGPCQGQLGELMKPAVACLKSEAPLQTCASDIIDTDIYIFTRHQTSQSELDPVSIVKAEKGQTCFYTALNADSAVTKTCFADLKTPQIRTTEKLDAFTLTEAHKGINPGQSVKHISIKKDFTSCGAFEEVPAKQDILGETICLLTALEPGGEVTKTCFNPDDPAILTLEKVEGLTLEFANTGKPVSIVIKDPSRLNLKTKPTTETCPCEVDQSIKKTIE